MGTALAVTAGVGAGLNLVGNVIGAGAASDAARAEQAVATTDRQRAEQFAAPSPEELAQLNQAVELNDKDIARKEELLASADPALIEAGKQALQLLKGEEAATLAPLRRDLAEAREELEDRLRQQLGSGFATSTAGAQALNDFDAEAGQAVAQEQDRTLGRLLGVAQNISAQGLSSNIAASGNIASLFGNIRNRQVNAVTGNPLAPFAGAGSVGRARLGQGFAQFGGQVTQGATMAMLLGGLGGGEDVPGLGGEISGSKNLSNPTLGSGAGLGRRKVPIGLGGNFKF